MPLVNTLACTRRSAFERRSPTSEIGLGDYLDVAYSVLVDVGGTELPLILDTGSADLWTLSRKAPLPTGLPYYMDTAFQVVGVAANILYGDSRTGTQARGPIGYDSARITEFSLQSQYFALVSSTNTSVTLTGSSGILGLGFPLNSVIWNTLVNARYSSQRRTTRFSNTSNGNGSNLATRVFPDLSFVVPPLEGKKDSLLRAIDSQDAVVAPTVEQVLETFSLYGPPVSRLSATGSLSAPMFSVSLQRDTFEIGGNAGSLTLGALPHGVNESGVMWVNVRLYSPEQGGLAAPAASPHELYPLAWEIPVDDVYLDGQKLPRSNLSSSTLALTALIDTGSSLVRGPQDVLSAIYTILGSDTYPCAHAHTLAFSVGGRLFPVDPRDFGSQTYDDTPTICTPNLAPADTPAGGFLYSWSLGDPFLKGVLAAFYYGNLTYPSRDPPRVGLLSTVPTDADAHLVNAVDDATAAHVMLPATMEPAPPGMSNASTTDAQGVPQAAPGGRNQPLASAATKRPPPPLMLAIIFSMWAVWALLLS
ncbi:aspartic peptidase domain-containing protein [Vararia minispora EC-137]|uniref:Aspartic peptidase domain-containing protein n=1 Tax=Vararia minispora EC-137 TaxID=1314806 RepID=A0ACB8QDA8_9AGAM|nr:aspartic peptidase domain-containing protein [Vararia minispora EC-137]